jgi:hypothetical protein
MRPSSMNRAGPERCLASASTAVDLSIGMPLSMNRKLSGLSGSSPLATAIARPVNFH